MNDSPSAADALAAWRDEQAVRDLVARTAARLDREDFIGWLELFDVGAEYELCAYSPEIRRSMSWWKSGRAALEKQLREIPQHERDTASRLHVLGPVLVELDGDRARAETPFALFRTMSDGETRLYAVGRYEDDVVKKSGSWFYTRHRNILETRVLDSFTHVPL
jgi:3-phenylpropionate/cinnamic acid dioxygenase small subunit